MKLFVYLVLFLTLSCSSNSKNTKNQIKKTRAELEQLTKEIPSPARLDEKQIRKELNEFKNILNSKKTLAVSDWALHDKLLNYYILLKNGLGKPNTILIPAHGRWTKDFESYCLEPKKASPDPNEVFQ